MFARRLDGESLDRFTAELVNLYDQRIESGEGGADRVMQTRLHWGHVG